MAVKDKRDELNDEYIGMAKMLLRCWWMEAFTTYMENDRDSIQYG
jgi:hypothetical protein